MQDEVFFHLFYHLTIINYVENDRSKLTDAMTSA